jgi:hypothetical protein
VHVHRAQGAAPRHPFASGEGLALLFEASSSTLLDVCANPQWLGTRPGLTGVLHTHGRALVYHPHVH